MTKDERERLEDIKGKYQYFESHGIVDALEVYNADPDDLVADLSFLISLINKDI